MRIPGGAHPAGLALFLTALALVALALLQIPVLGLETVEMAILAAVFAGVSGVYNRSATDDSGQGC